MTHCDLDHVRFGGNHNVNLHQLLDLFYRDNEHLKLASFEETPTVPPPYDQLLDHESHMTVTVEAYYGSPVDVHVHRHKLEEHWYCREITLVTQSNQQVVQYGIVRLDTTAIAPDVWKLIQQGTIPLGRVLIEHDVLRKVELCGLWEIQCESLLAEKLHCEVGQRVCGRTARIHCDGEPAIELLEIIAPTS